MVGYLETHVRPGQTVVVSDLVNRVFTGAEERAALDRLFATFFKLPLFVARYQAAAGRPPSLAEISEQFRFGIPGEAALMLRIMESDPRVPRFLERDPKTGEIQHVDVQAILSDPRFGRSLERSLTGLTGRPEPAFSTTTFEGQPFSSAALRGRPHLVYFWFTGCPPCVRTVPLLARLQREYASEGFEIVALNADRALEVPVTDAERTAHAKKTGMTFTLAYADAGILDAYGAVSVFPTFLFVDRRGIVARQLVGFQEQTVLEAALHRALD